MVQEYPNKIKALVKGGDLRKARLDAGFTTVKMASLAGVKTRKTYENWERGHGTPNINQYLAMMMGCGEDIPKLLSELIDKTQS